MKVFVTQEEAQVLFQLLKSQNCYYQDVCQVDIKDGKFESHWFSYRINDIPITIHFYLQENTIKFYYVYFDGLRYYRHIREQ